MQYVTVIAVAEITVHPLVFSTEKDSHGFCCNYLFDFIDIVKETVHHANKQSGPCCVRQLWASLWLWLGQSKVNSLVRVLGRHKMVPCSRSQVCLGIGTWPGLGFFCLIHLCPYTMLPLCQVCIKQPRSLQSQNCLGWPAKSFLVVISGDTYPGAQYWQLKKWRHQAQQPSIKSFFLSLNVSLSVAETMEEPISLVPTSNELAQCRGRRQPSLQCHIPPLSGKGWKWQSGGIHCRAQASAEPPRHPYARNNLEMFPLHLSSNSNASVLRSKEVFQNEFTQ